MAKIAKIVLVVLVAVVIILQFIPAKRTNPPVAGEIAAPAEVRAVLKRACYDCHSNETVWPWYSQVAPVKFMIVEHVNDGRKHLNFSEWDSYDARRKDHKLEEVWEEIEKGAMPLKNYIPLHKEAQLSDQDKALIKSWTEAMRAELDSSAMTGG